MIIAHGHTLYTAGGGGACWVSPPPINESKKNCVSTNATYPKNGKFIILIQLLKFQLNKHLKGNFRKAIYVVIMTGNIGDIRVGSKLKVVTSDLSSTASSFTSAASRSTRQMCMHTQFTCQV